MVTRIAVVVIVIQWLCGCATDDPLPPTLAADLPLHLEQHLDVAHIDAAVPFGRRRSVPPVARWRFDVPQPEWKPVVPLEPEWSPAEIKTTEDALRLVLLPGCDRHGGMYVDLPDWRRADWAWVVVRARTSDDIDHIEVGFNLRDEPGPSAGERWRLRFDGEEMPVITDGLVHSYRMRADWSWNGWQGPWRQLGVEIGGAEGASIDILSVSVIPKGDEFGSEAAGVRILGRENRLRRALFAHTPAQLDWRVRVPEQPFLHTGLGVVLSDEPVTFRVVVRPDGGSPSVVLEEEWGDPERWADRSVDLSEWANEVVTLALESDAESGNQIALWSAPTLAGARHARHPNVILYVIDAGGADFMSSYRYSRPTTPTLERLAADGVLFERAYSTSTWTKPSTTSFMTSLHHSVLGGHVSECAPLPSQAVTMAQHFHRAGYLTAAFVSNPFAGRISSLDRGVDVMRDIQIGLNSESSKGLHEDFWRWREAYGAEPYWVHFQTTDVHSPHNPAPPFAGRFVSADDRRRYDLWDDQLRIAGGRGPYSGNFEKLGISRSSYAGLQGGLYDETLLHNDHQLGLLVERLKAAGEWQHTLLVVTGDHGYVAGNGHRNRDPLPPKWAVAKDAVEAVPHISSHMTHVPLIVVWPERITGGRRIGEPVSLIDLLPTILELAGLPPPDPVAQGRSLASALFGREDWEPTPVILDQFNVDPKTGVLRGNIEVIDGRWGASLEIDPAAPDEDIAEDERRPAQLLLYDVVEDPHCLELVNEQRPDLVEKYTNFLLEKWTTHRELARGFTRPDAPHLTPAQLETLRALGYLQ